MDDIRRQILAELEQFSERPMLAQDEITAADYAARFGCSHQLAAQRLLEMVKKNQMTVRKGVYDPRSQKVVNGYRLIDGASSRSEDARPHDEDA
ncbi:MAG: hypothetical protein RBT75_07675 [Anaerolineae bacterium]|jgi:hypothetical protein|nr:hypothetical protein [Anaerolineae bacterium]